MLQSLRRPWILAAAAASLALVGCLADMNAYRDASAARQGLSAQALANPGVFELPDPSGFTRVAAISDVHGMYSNLVPLLVAAKIMDANHNWVGGKTLLVIVGDSIDKGPDSLDVLNTWMTLQQQAPASGGLVVHLLGNHEAEFLADPTNSKTASLQAELKQKNLPLTDLTDPTTAHGGFLHQEPIAAKVGQWLFCHAGLFPNESWANFKTQAIAALARGNYGDPFFADPNSILEAKDWWQTPATRQDLESRLAANGMWGLVQGHQPNAYGLPNTTGSIDNGHLIKIDNGMAPEAGSNPGRVLIFPTPAQLLQAAEPDAIAVGPDGTVLTIDKHAGS